MSYWYGLLDQVGLFKQSGIISAVFYPLGVFPSLFVFRSHPRLFFLFEEK